MGNKKKCIYLRVPSELCNCLYKSMNLTEIHQAFGMKSCEKSKGHNRVKWKLKKR